MKEICSQTQHFNIFFFVYFVPLWYITLKTDGRIKIQNVMHLMPEDAQ